MKTSLIIVLITVVIVAGTLVYMKSTCSGLWERQPSKIPSNFLTKKEGEADDYTKCVYIGFSGMISKWKNK
jgi:hypothetical protein